MANPSTYYVQPGQQAPQGQPMMMQMPQNTFYPPPYQQGGGRNRGKRKFDNFNDGGNNNGGGGGNSKMDRLLAGLEADRAEKKAEKDALEKAAEALRIKKEREEELREHGENVMKSTKLLVEGFVCLWIANHTKLRKI